MDKLSEEEAEFVLREVLAAEQRRMQTLLRPYVVALYEIERRKPPRPFVGPDGRTFVYCGPTASETAGKYKAPGWLEAMCWEDIEFIDMLRQYRRRYARGADADRMPES